MHLHNPLPPIAPSPEVAAGRAARAAARRQAQADKQQWRAAVPARRAAWLVEHDAVRAHRAAAARARYNAYRKGEPARAQKARQAAEAQAKYEATVAALF